MNGQKEKEKVVFTIFALNRNTLVLTFHEEAKSGAVSFISPTSSFRSAELSYRTSFMMAGCSS